MEQEKKLLPVTVLSGFLGSGKTTLLKHILENKQNLKCALIVNDMAEVNVDANLIKDTQLVKSQEKMISMQNGCICCTLREDLLIHVAELAKQNKFDYLIIESTGISEPLQVAETFTFDLPEDQRDDQENMDFLKDYAKLDTCVTVVDALNFFSFFNTEKSLTEKFPEEKPAKEDERTVTELMIDQLEFSNVIIINKTDLVSEEQLKSVEQMCKQLNPEAEIIYSKYCDVDLKKIINTNKFDMQKAQQNKDWLAQDRYNFIPETVEYGITSFIYKNKKPFDNLKIHKLLLENFYLDLDARRFEAIQEEEKNHDHSKKKEEEIEEQEGNEEDEWEDEEDEEEEEEEEVDQETYDREIEAGMRIYKKERQKAFKQKSQSVFKDLWRSKGTFWIAGNSQDFYSWSQAGIVNQVHAGGIFDCALDEESKAEIPNFKEEIESKFDPLIGDRETEIVFIGKKVDKEKLTQTLDECLVSEEEYQKLLKNEDKQLKYAKHGKTYIIP